MSCLETEKTREFLEDKFHCLLQDNDELEDEVKLNLFSSGEQWREKEFGDWGEDAFDRIFNNIWEWDPEWLYNDMVGCIYAYIKTQEGVINYE